MSTVNLFIYIVGTDVPFPVSIDRSKTVGDLKDAIFKKNSETLHGIDARQLTLYKVRLIDDDSLGERASEELAEKKGTALRSTSKLSKVFDDAMMDEDGAVHVLVEIPYGAGECLEPRTRLKRLIECFIHCFILNFPGWSLPHLQNPYPISTYTSINLPLILSHTF
jgi:hypothetical protein